MTRWAVEKRKILDFDALLKFESVGAMSLSGADSERKSAMGPGIPRVENTMVMLEDSIGKPSQHWQLLD